MRLVVAVIAELSRILISCISLLRVVISHSPPDLIRRFIGLGIQHQIWVFNPSTRQNIEGTNRDFPGIQHKTWAANTTSQLPRRSPHSVKSTDCLRE